MTLTEFFLNACSMSSDINEHLPTLKQYASECDVVMELGVRTGNSTFALLSGLPKKMRSFDIGPFCNKIICKDLAEANGIDWQFIQENVLTTDKIEECDLLFIDTLHSYFQLKKELELHGNKSRKYIVLHDTFTFGKRDEFTPAGQPNLGLLPAIFEFLDNNKHWAVHKIYDNNNGLMILKRS